MLKHGANFLGQFFQQLLIFLVLTVLVVLIAVGFILYPAPTDLQIHPVQPLEDPIQTLLIIPSNTLGE